MMILWQHFLQEYILVKSHFSPESHMKHPLYSAFPQNDGRNPKKKIPFGCWNVSLWMSVQVILIILEAYEFHEWRYSFVTVWSKSVLIKDQNSFQVNHKIIQNLCPIVVIAVISRNQRIPYISNGKTQKTRCRYETESEFHRNINMMA